MVGGNLVAAKLLSYFWPPSRLPLSLWDIRVSPNGGVMVVE